MDKQPLITTCCEAKPKKAGEQWTCPACGLSPAGVRTETHIEQGVVSPRRKEKLGPVKFRESDAPE